MFWGNRLGKCSYPIGVSRVHTRKTPQGTYFVSRWCEPASFAAGECWREGLEHRPTAIGDTRNNRMRENDVNRTTMNCVLFKVVLVVVVVVRTTSPATTTHHTTTQRTNGTNRTTWSTTRRRARGGYALTWSATDGAGPGEGGRGACLGRVRE